MFDIDDIIKKGKRVIEDTNSMIGEVCESIASDIDSEKFNKDKIVDKIKKHFNLQKSILVEETSDGIVVMTSAYGLDKENIKSVYKNNEMSITLKDNVTSKFHANLDISFNIDKNTYDVTKSKLSLDKGVLKINIPSKNNNDEKEFTID